MNYDPLIMIATTNVSLPLLLDYRYRVSEVVDILFFKSRTFLPLILCCLQLNIPVCMH